MRIEFERSGGFAGLVQRCCLDTETLPPRQAREIEQLVAAAGLPELEARPAPVAAGADRFQYDLTITQRGASHRLRVGEGSVPPQLRPLLDRLLAHARGS
ncbi:MAG TPA: protealysin inhibitor emfourin [Mycobacteriales bacterium]|nr:protealysin inhibitor emfourin [Mycobacteriales bacterium]